MLDTIPNFHLFPRHLKKDVADRGGVESLTDKQVRLLREASDLMDGTFQPFNFDYVYMFQVPSGVFKVGRSRNPRSRAKAIETSMAEDVEVVAAFAVVGGGAYKAESAAQRALKDRGLHVRREWFRGQAKDWVKVVVEACRSDRNYLPLKEAVALSMRYWHPYLMLAASENCLDRAREQKSCACWLTEQLGLDWQF